MSDISASDDDDDILAHGFEPQDLVLFESDPKHLRTGTWRGSRPATPPFDEVGSTTATGRPFDDGAGRISPLAPPSPPVSKALGGGAGSSSSRSTDASSGTGIGGAGGMTLAARRGKVVGSVRAPAPAGPDGLPAPLLTQRALAAAKKEAIAAARAVAKAHGASGYRVDAAAGALDVSPLMLKKPRAAASGRRPLPPGPSPLAASGLARRSSDYSSRPDRPYSPGGDDVSGVSGVSGVSTAGDDVNSPADNDALWIKGSPIQPTPTILAAAVGGRKTSATGGIIRASPLVSAPPSANGAAGADDHPECMLSNDSPRAVQSFLRASSDSYRRETALRAKSSQQQQQHQDESRAAMVSSPLGSLSDESIDGDGRIRLRSLDLGTAMDDDREIDTFEIEAAIAAAAVATASSTAATATAAAGGALEPEALVDFDNKNDDDDDEDGDDDDDEQGSISSTDNSETTLALELALADVKEQQDKRERAGKPRMLSRTLDIDDNIDALAVEMEEQECCDADDAEAAAAAAAATTGTTDRDRPWSPLGTPPSSSKGNGFWSGSPSIYDDADTEAGYSTTGSPASPGSRAPISAARETGTKGQGVAGKRRDRLGSSSSVGSNSPEASPARWVGRKSRAISANKSRGSGERPSPAKSPLSSKSSSEGRGRASDAGSNVASPAWNKGRSPGVGSSQTFAAGTNGSAGKKGKSDQKATPSKAEEKDLDDDTDAIVSSLADQMSMMLTSEYGTAKAEEISSKMLDDINVDGIFHVLDTANEQRHMIVYDLNECPREGFTDHTHELAGGRDGARR